MKGDNSCIKSLRSTPAIPEIASMDGVSGLCRKFTLDVVDILHISAPTHFFCELRDFIENLERTEKAFDYFCDRLLDTLF